MLLEQLLKNEGDPSADDIIDILSDVSVPEDKDLPDTGIGLETERFLSTIFIAGKDYGTRCSTVLMVDRENNVTFIERITDPGENNGLVSDFRFRIR